MDPRLVASILLVGSLLPAAASATPPAALARRPALTFFSSLTEQPLARLEAAAVVPRFARHGPFLVPAPGLEVEAPVLSLHDEPCTEEDWARFLAEFAAWRALPAKARLELIAPDGRAFVFLDPPATAHGILSGLVRPLSSPAHADEEPADTADRLLRIRRDSEGRLVLHLAPAPSLTAAPAILSAP